MAWQAKAVTAEPPPGQVDDEALEALMVLVKRLVRSGGREANVQPTGDDPWLTPADAAAYAAISEDTLRLWIHSGRLPAGRVGKVIRVKRSDIDALLKGRAEEASRGAEAAQGEEQLEVAAPPEPAADERATQVANAILGSMGSGRRKRRE